MKLLFAIKYNNNFDEVKTLIENGVDVNEKKFMKIQL